MDQSAAYIPLATGDRLHMARFCGDPQGPVVFLLHGAIENGRIFYSLSGKGLAPWLASQGFDVFVPDLRGRGLSTPAISARSAHGQTEAITEEIPALLGHIRHLRGEAPQYWMAHSWGGVLLMSYLARYRAPQLRAMVFFAVKRIIRARNLPKLLQIDLFWNRIAFALTRVYGYLPARGLGWGADNETAGFYHHMTRWLNPSPWIDPADGFDYRAALATADLPPTLYLAGAGDTHLGHPRDVFDFMLETGADKACYRILSRRHGHRRDYGHIDILTHPEAAEDHFPLAQEWLQRHPA